MINRKPDQLGWILQDECSQTRPGAHSPNINTPGIALEGNQKKRTLLFLVVSLGIMLSFGLKTSAQTQSSGLGTQGGKLPVVSKAELQVCPCAPGELVRVSDDVRGLWVTDGNQWFPIAAQVNARWFGAKPDDRADDSGALAAALAVAQSVIVPAGTFEISSDLTIPAGKRLVMENGALLSINPNRTVRLLGPFEAGLYQVFTGRGTVVFGRDSTRSLANAVLELYPQWWGAKADGKADDFDALSKSVAAAADCHGHVRLVGNYRISQPLSLPNGVSLAGVGGHAQNWAWITADGSQGFSGNYLLVSDPGAAVNQYSSIENVHFQILNIQNASFEALHIKGWSETAKIKNISFNMRDSSIGRVLYFDNFGPVEFDNINLYYSRGQTRVANEPMYVKAVNGLILRNLNYTAVSPKAPHFESGLFMLLEGLQIETHPTIASEPGIALFAGTGGLTFRDSSLLTDLDNSTGVKIQSSNFPDLGGFLIEQVALQRHPGVAKGSFDKYVVIRDDRGTERAWDTARLATSANSQHPTLIQRFSNKEQVFGGVQVNNGPRVFQDLFLFSNVTNNGTVTVPFNPRVLTGTYGTGNVLILVNARSNITNNAAMIWLTYVDLPQGSGGVQPVFNYVVGNSSSNWAAAYSAESINLTNKAGATMDQVTVTIIHSTFHTWPVSRTDKLPDYYECNSQVERLIRCPATGRRIAFSISPVLSEV